MKHSTRYFALAFVLFSLAQTTGCASFMEGYRQGQARAEANKRAQIAEAQRQERQRGYELVRALAAMDYSSCIATLSDQPQSVNVPVCQSAQAYKEERYGDTKRLLALAMSNAQRINQYQQRQAQSQVWRNLLDTTTRMQAQDQQLRQEMRQQQRTTTCNPTRSNGGWSCSSW